MKKEKKKYHIIAKLHRYSDYDIPNDKVIRTEEFYRMAVSPSQAVNCLKRAEGLKDYDNACSSEAYKWRFEVEEVKAEPTLIDEFDALRNQQI